MTPRDRGRRPWRRPVVVLALAFGAGSVPCSNLVARRVRRVDLRDVGPGTVSGTSLYDVAGFGPLVVGGLADVLKGAVGPLLAGRDRPGLAAAAGGLAVVGHDWSPWLAGAGGRGLSPAMGALAVQAPSGTAALLGGLAGGRAVRRTGFATFVTLVGLVPLLRAVEGRRGAWAAAAVVVPILVKRLLGNTGPAGDAGTYRHRLLYDRDGTATPRPAPA